MLNHFKTLLLNETFVDYSDHIDPNYHHIELPSQLAAVQNILIPQGANRAIKFEAAQCYLNAIEAANIGNVITEFDPRITYNLRTDTTKFSFNHISNPIYTTDNPDDINDTKLFISYISGSSYNQTELILRIKQQTTTNVVDIQEIDSSGNVIKDILLNQTLVWSSPITKNGVITPITMNDYGLIINLYSPRNFSTTSGQTWVVTIKRVSTFDFAGVYTSLTYNQPQILDMYNYKSKYNVSKYDAMWVNHFSSVYKIAGLCASLVYRIQTYMEK